MGEQAKAKINKTRAVLPVLRVASRMISGPRLPCQKSHNNTINGIQDPIWVMVCSKEESRFRVFIC